MQFFSIWNVYYCYSASTSNLMLTIPVNPASIISPFLTAPTPAGDPVTIKSPGSNVKYLERYDIR